MFLLSLTFLISIFFGEPLLSQEYKIGDRLEPSDSTNQKADPQYPEINWPALAPPNWDTDEAFKKFNFMQFEDGDPRAEAELKKMQAAFNNAPIEEKMNGKKITISGFMVPLEESAGNVTEFLLVAFFGACIHVPPPPANQIIHVTASEPVRGLEAMAPITVKGTIKTVYTDSSMGGSGYKMEKALVIPHVNKTCMFAPTCD